MASRFGASFRAASQTQAGRAEPLVIVAAAADDDDDEDDDDNNRLPAGLITDSEPSCYFPLTKPVDCRRPGSWQPLAGAGEPA